MESTRVVEIEYSPSSDVSGSLISDMSSLSSDAVDTNEDYENYDDEKFNEEMLDKSHEEKSGNFFTSKVGTVELCIVLAIALIAGITLGVFWSRKVIKKINEENKL